MPPNKIKATKQPDQVRGESEGGVQLSPSFDHFLKSLLFYDDSKGGVGLLLKVDVRGFGPFTKIGRVCTQRCGGPDGHSDVVARELKRLPEVCDDEVGVRLTGEDGWTLFVAGKALGLQVFADGLELRLWRAGGQTHCVELHGLGFFHALPRDVMKDHGCDNDASEKQ